MDSDCQPGVPGSAPDAPLGIPRILTDLAEGRLDDEEATTVADWLATASDEEPPAGAVDRAVRIARAGEGGVSQ